MIFFVALIYHGESFSTPSLTTFAHERVDPLEPLTLFVSLGEGAAAVPSDWAIPSILDGFFVFCSVVIQSGLRRAMNGFNIRLSLLYYRSKCIEVASKLAEWL